MTEILTESFCERCGTRYTFESARPRVRLKGVKVLSRGLKNFVLSDDTSMDEAMATARNETDRDATSQQLDAFHKTFNFCMSCRQYTCPNCWNEAEARCLTCAPHLGLEVMPAPFPDLPTGGYPMADTNGANGSNGSAHDPWPAETEAAGVAGASDTAEVEFDAVARLDALTLAAPAESAVEAPVEDGPPIPATVEAPVETTSDVDATAEMATEAEPAAMAEMATEAESTAPVSSLPEAWIVKDASADPEPTQAPAARTEHDQAVDVPAAAVEVAPAEVEPTIAAITAVPAPEPVAFLVAAEAEHTSEAPAAEAEIDADPDQDPEVAARLAAMAAATTVIDVGAPQHHGTEGPTNAGASGLLRRFRAGQSLDAELDAYERQEAAAIAGSVVPKPDEPMSEVEVAEPTADVTAQTVVVAQPEPVAATQTEVTAELAARPVEPEPVIDDVVPQPTWRMVAPDPTVEPSEVIAPSPSTAATRATPTGEPQWPTRPEWLGSAPSAGLPFLGRSAAPQGGLEALWAESTREVVDAPGPPGRPAVSAVQPCVSCGLSLSATARFCRRCGTPQAS